MSVDVLRGSSPRALSSPMSRRSSVMVNDENRKERSIKCPEFVKKGTSYIYFHLLVQPIIHDEAVRHPYPMGFHGMPRDVGIVAHIGVVEVGHRFLVIVGRRRINGREPCHDWEMAFQMQ